MKPTEHLYIDKASHVYKYLQTSQQCKYQCDASYFDILDCALTKISAQDKGKVTHHMRKAFTH